MVTTYLVLLLLFFLDCLSSPTGSARKLGTSTTNKIGQKGELHQCNPCTMETQSITNMEQMIRFDTDSDIIGINNCCAGCMSHVKDSYIGTLNTCNQTIKGFGGTETMDFKIGTFNWSWANNAGVCHTFCVFMFLLATSDCCTLRIWTILISKQHGVQPLWRTANRSKCVLDWDMGEQRHHMQLSRVDNDNCCFFSALLWLNKI